MEDKDNRTFASEQQAVEYTNKMYHMEDDSRDQRPTHLSHIKHVPVSLVYV